MAHFVPIVFRLAPFIERWSFLSVHTLAHLVGIRKLLVEASSAGPVGQEWTVELDIDIELQAEMKANAIHYLDFSLNPKITHIRLRGSWWFFLSLKDPIRTLATNAEDFDITRL